MDESAVAFTSANCVPVDLAKHEIVEGRLIDKARNEAD